MTPTEPAGLRLFFVHVMKTAGTTLLTQLRRAFPSAAMFPPPMAPDAPAEAQWELMQQYSALDALLELSEAQRAELSLVSGHFPFAAVDLLGGPADAGGRAGSRPSCITLVREPVARTLSMLGQLQRTSEALHGWSFPAIYEQPWVFQHFLANYQTRVLSMTLEEALAPRIDRTGFRQVVEQLIPATAAPEVRARITAMVPPDVFDPATLQVVEELEALGVDLGPDLEVPRRLFREMRERDPRPSPPPGMTYYFTNAVMSRPSPSDADRLRRAEENLASCRVVGITDDYVGFVEDLNRSCGLELPHQGRGNVGAPVPDLPPSFLRRIEDDTELDQQLYQHARCLVEQRRR